MAAAWLAANYPEELACFPDEDSGRSHRTVSLDDQTYAESLWEAASFARPGVRRNPGWRRAEAVASHRPGVVGPLSCSHCAVGRAVYGRLGWCQACYRYRRRRGSLPGVAVLAARAARAELREIEA